MQDGLTMAPYFLFGNCEKKTKQTYRKWFNHESEVAGKQSESDQRAKRLRRNIEAGNLIVLLFSCYANSKTKIEHNKIYI